MATYETVGVNLELVAKKIGVQELRRELKQISKEAEHTKKLLNKVATGRSGKDQGLVGAFGDQAIRNIQNKHKKLNRDILNEANRFKMEYLGIMFGGMALQRAFGGMIKNVYAGFTELTKGAVNPLSTSLTRLEANTKFLQFALVDAAAPFITRIADALSSMALALAKSDPSTLQTLAIAIGALATAGWLLSFTGQGILLWDAVGRVLKSASSTEVGKINNLSAALKGLGAAAAALVAIKLTFDIIKLFKTDGGDLDAAVILGATSLGALLGSFLGGPLGALIGAGVGAVAGVVTVTLDAAFEIFKNEGGFLAGMSKIHEAMKAALMNTGWKMFIPTVGPFLLVREGIAQLRLAGEVEVTEELKPAIEDLQAAQLLSTTTAPEIENLGNTITAAFTPALEKMNEPLATSVDEMKGLNNNIIHNMTRINEIGPSLEEDTRRRQDNAAAIWDQARAQAKLNKEIAAEGREEGVSEV